MDSYDFIKWREMHFGLDRKKASATLGIALNSLRAYEAGKDIPPWVPLACAAIAAGLQPWTLPADMQKAKKRNPELKPSTFPPGNPGKAGLHKGKNSSNARKQKAATCESDGLS